jgi:transaldolase
MKLNTGAAALLAGLWVSGAHVTSVMGFSAASPAAGTALERLSQLTTLSIDSGDFDTIAKYAATGCITDATTNPLFVSQAGSNGDARYEALVEEAVTYSKEKLCISDGCPSPAEAVDLAIDRLAVNLGREIAQIVPGRVSTEVDIRLSYDTEATVERARRIIDMYREMGVDKSRILIKLAGTWEGIRACEILEKEGIQCNITLVFSFLQAAAAAQAGAYLISPFPGRIKDWHSAKGGRKGYPPLADPGVLCVKQMYAYFRKYGYGTICMPASWRPSRGADVDGADVDEILALAGVDEMTIPPPLLESLAARPASDVVHEVSAERESATCIVPDFKFTEESYRMYWEADGCGVDKLKEGIDAFTGETEKLSDILAKKF